MKKSILKDLSDSISDIQSLSDYTSGEMKDRLIYDPNNIDENGFTMLLSNNSSYENNLAAIIHCITNLYIQNNKHPGALPLSNVYILFSYVNFGHLVYYISLSDLKCGRIDCLLRKFRNKDLDQFLDSINNGECKHHLDPGLEDAADDFNFEKAVTRDYIRLFEEIMFKKDKSADDEANEDLRLSRLNFTSRSCESMKITISRSLENRIPACASKKNIDVVRKSLETLYAYKTTPPDFSYNSEINRDQLISKNKIDPITCETPLLKDVLRVNTNYDLMYRSEPFLDSDYHPEFVDRVIGHNSNSFLDPEVEEETFETHNDLVFSSVKDEVETVWDDKKKKGSRNDIR
ncbi:hypothetical protein COBT_000527 [Conglomerata obtusa]